MTNDEIRTTDTRVNVKVQKEKSLENRKKEL